MPTFSTRLLTTGDEFAAYATAWDDLWQRSASTSATLRAALLALHREHFQPEARLWCSVVEDDRGRPLAALPLVEQRMAMLTTGGLPSNEWSSSGDLLLDETADVQGVCDTLAASLRHAPWPLLWLDWVPYETFRWKSLLSALRRLGADVETRRSFQVGWLDTEGDWDAYRATWSKNFRRNMARYRKRLEADGAFTADFLADFAGGAWEEPLREVFEVENRSWKADEGSSVLQTEGMWDFYRRQARQLAEWGQLNLNLLRLDGKPIAAEYGYSAKGVYHPFKIGYDAACHTDSPGNVLHSMVLQRLFADPSIRGVDFLGPISRSCESWRPARYAVGRVLVAPKSFIGRAMLGAYRHVWPTVKRLRSGRDTAAPAEALATVDQ